jgi:hypothetical protein
MASIEKQVISIYDEQSAPNEHIKTILTCHRYRLSKYTISKGVIAAALKRTSELEYLFYSSNMNVSSILWLQFLTGIRSLTPFELCNLFVYPSKQLILLSFFYLFASKYFTVVMNGNIISWLSCLNGMEFWFISMNQYTTAFALSA